MTIELFVKDKDTGTIHRVGDDVHDSLYVDENGYVQYYNMQNGCGTMSGCDDTDEATYIFLPFDPLSPGSPEKDKILRQAEEFCIRISLPESCKAKTKRYIYSVSVRLRGGTSPHQST